MVPFSVAPPGVNLQRETFDPMAHVVCISKILVDVEEYSGLYYHVWVLANIQFLKIAKWVFVWCSMFFSFYITCKTVKGAVCLV